MVCVAYHFVCYLQSILDYECDSDEEWEEEEPGESVGGSVAGGSDDEEGENDYDVDNEFMVPHGYLSEEVRNNHLRHYLYHSISSPGCKDKLRKMFNVLITVYLFAGSNGGRR